VAHSGPTDEYKIKLKLLQCFGTAFQEIQVGLLQIQWVTMNTLGETVKMLE
jgi:hypothetical protein